MNLEISDKLKLDVNVIKEHVNGGNSNTDSIAVAAFVVILDEFDKF